MPIGSPYTELVRDLSILAGYRLDSAAKRPPEEPGGLNIEGLSATPQGKLLIAFRNPVSDGKALIVPLENPDRVVFGEVAKLGEPIRLSLNGYGIRSIDYWEGRDKYLIVAGQYDRGGDFKLFQWSGSASENPELIVDVPGELQPEALITYPGSRKIQLLSDDGTRRVGSGEECNDGPSKAWSFRSLFLPVSDPVAAGAPGVIYGATPTFSTSAPQPAGPKGRNQVKVPLDFNAFSAFVAPELDRIEASFREQRAQLRPISLGGVSEAFLTEDVDHLLISTEDRLLKTLDPEELAAFRDSIRLRFRRIRKNLGLPPAAATGEPIFGGKTEIALVALRQEPGGAAGTLLLLRRIVDPVLDGAGKLLRTLTGLAEQGRFSLRLCVVSHPVAGKFYMRPPEYHAGIQSGLTVFDISKTAIGRYFYRIEDPRKRYDPIKCGWESGGEDDECLDLLDHKGDQLLDCDFQQGTCLLRDLRPGECPSR